MFSRPRAVLFAVRHDVMSVFELKRPQNFGFERTDNEKPEDEASVKGGLFSSNIQHKV